MTTAHENILLQSMKLEGKEIDLAFMKSCTLVETLDLSGPRLMVAFYDPDALIRDTFGIRQSHTLEIEFADIWHRDGLDKTMEFTVEPMSPVTGDRFELNLFQKDIHRLKQPATEGRIFRRKPLSALAQAVIPTEDGEPKFDIATFPAMLDYALQPDERPSKLLRRAAREAGAMLFYRRGVIVGARLADLLAVDPPAHEYHYLDRREKNQILHFSQPNADEILKDRIGKSYRGWSMTDGFIESGKGKGRPPEFSSLPRKAALDNLASYTVPVLDLTVPGNGFLMAGETMEIVWNKAVSDDPLDESLPEKVVIGVVAHHYEAQKYSCRVKGFLPNEET